MATQGRFPSAIQRTLNLSTDNPPGLIGWWTFDGLTPRDVSGRNGVALALSGTSVSYRPSPFGTSAVLNASFFAGASTAYEPASGLTFAGWINPPNFTAKHVVCGYGIGGPILYVDTTSKPTFSKNSGSGSVVGATSITAGVWTHVAGSYDLASGVFNVYVNGVLAATSTLAGVTWTASTFGLGGSAGITNTGAIADVRAFNRALTAAEVYRIYANALQVTDLEPMALFTGSISAAVGSSAVAGVGHTLFNAMGAAVAASGVLSLGKSIFSAIGSAIGSSIAAVAGAALFSAIGAAAGSSAVAGASPGGTSVADPGSSAGSVVVTGVGASTAAAAGSSVSAGSVTGAGDTLSQQTVSGAGTTSGSCHVSGVGSQRVIYPADAHGGWSTVADIRVEVY